MNNQFNLTYETDLNQGLASTTLPMLFLYDDSLAHVFTVKTTRDGKPNSLTGYSVHAYFMPSNSDACVYITGTVDENGYAVVTLEPACYAFIGRFSLVIRAEKGSAVTSIFRGEGYVGQSHTDAILDPGEALPSLAALEAKINALTYADVGAAPAGYGLGDICTTFAADTITKTGWYKGSIGSVSGDTWGAATNFWIIYHIEHGVRNEATQKAWMPACYGNCSIERIRSEGVYGEWEWVNPPMTLGVEYRTTKRDNGRAIYTKAVSCGKGPSGGAANLSHGIVGKVEFTEVKCKGVSEEGWGAFFNQYLSFGEGTNLSPNIAINYSGDLSSRNLYLTMEYVKV